MKTNKGRYLIFVLIFFMIVMVFYFWGNIIVFVKNKMPESNSIVEEYITNYLENKHPLDNFEIISLEEFNVVISDYGDIDGSPILPHRKIGAYYWKYKVYSELYDDEFELLYLNDNGVKNISTSYLYFNLFEKIEDEYEEFLVGKEYSLDIRYYESNYFITINEDSYLKYQDINLEEFTELLMYKNLDDIEYVDLDNRKTTLYIERWNINCLNNDKIRIEFNPNSYMNIDEIEYSYSYVYLDEYIKLFDIRIPKLEVE